MKIADTKVLLFKSWASKNKKLKNQTNYGYKQYTYIKESYFRVSRLFVFIYIYILILCTHS